MSYGGIAHVVEADTELLSMYVRRVVLFRMSLMHARPQA